MGGQGRHVDQVGDRSLDRHDLGRVREAEQQRADHRGAAQGLQQLGGEVLSLGPQLVIGAVLTISACRTDIDNQINNGVLALAGDADDGTNFVPFTEWMNRFNAILWIASS